MPITEPSKSELPLSQGDILKDVTLFSTKGGWLISGGEAATSPLQYCIILSRPCGLEHKPTCIVAGIQKLTGNAPKGVDTFSKVRAFLTNIRDGNDSPDVFYLGQLPGLTGRWGAKLDTLFTIQLPKESTERQSFLTAKRIASLHSDFIRDLHVRIFNAFSSLGFNDCGWLTNEDLAWLVNQGESDLLAERTKVQLLKTEKSSREAEGTACSGSLEKAEQALIKLQEEISPYRREQELRSKTE